MSKHKIFLIVQSALCILITALIAASAVRIYLEGSAYQAAGHPSEWIYTREKVMESLLPILPLVLLSLAMSVYGWIRGIRDDHPRIPKAEPDLPDTSPEAARRRTLIRRALMAAAVVFILLGIGNGSMKDVLVKAIRICTECIGLG